jgi:hypothetical protein
MLVMRYAVVHVMIDKCCSHSIFIQCHGMHRASAPRFLSFEVRITYQLGAVSRSNNGCQDHQLVTPRKQISSYHLATTRFLDRRFIEEKVRRRRSLTEPNEALSHHSLTVPS